MFFLVNPFLIVGLIPGFTKSWAAVRAEARRGEHDLADLAVRVARRHLCGVCIGFLPDVLIAIFESLAAPDGFEPYTYY